MVGLKILNITKKHTSLDYIVDTNLYLAAIILGIY